MLKKPETFDFVGEMLIKKSKYLSEHVKEVEKPADDKLEWLFIGIDKHLFGFIYEITNPENSFYDKPFEIKFSCFFREVTNPMIIVDNEYRVLRGPKEEIGKIKIISKSVNE